ncbi:MAG: hypothetical protein IT457_09730 [Planctomycetes bacterium]|nr:hypothetical protein [Planctomycetota bacterium]
MAAPFKELREPALGSSLAGRTGWPFFLLAGLIAGAVYFGLVRESAPRTREWSGFWQQLPAPGEAELASAQDLAAEISNVARTLDVVRDEWLARTRNDTAGLSDRQAMVVDLGPQLMRAQSARLLAGRFRLSRPESAPVVPVRISGPENSYLMPGPALGSARVVFLVDGRDDPELAAMLDSMDEVQRGPR